MDHGKGKRSVAYGSINKLQIALHVRYQEEPVGACVYTAHSIYK